MTIVGRGPSNTIVDGNGAPPRERVVQVKSANTPVTLSGLTIQAGTSTTPPAADNPNAFAGEILTDSRIRGRDRPFDRSSLAPRFPG